MAARPKSPALESRVDLLQPRGPQPVHMTALLRADKGYPGPLPTMMTFTSVRRTKLPFLTSNMRRLSTLGYERLRTALDAQGGLFLRVLILELFRNPHCDAGQANAVSGAGCRCRQ